eukprot:365574-Chlamydomonas_euryale.AAC.15
MHPVPVERPGSRRCTNECGARVVAEVGAGYHEVNAIIAQRQLATRQVRLASVFGSIACHPHSKKDQAPAWCLLSSTTFQNAAHASVIA